MTMMASISNPAVTSDSSERSSKGQHATGVGGDRGLTEALRRVLEPAGEKRASTTINSRRWRERQRRRRMCNEPEDKQEIGENGAQQGQLSAATEQSM